MLAYIAIEFSERLFIFCQNKKIFLQVFFKLIKWHSASIICQGKNDNIDRSDVLLLAKEMNIKKAKSIIEEMNSVIQMWK